MSKGKDPAVLWYWNDWAGGTKTLSRFLKGAYMDLLDAQFNSQDNALTLDEIKIILHSDFDQAWPALKKKFKETENGSYQNERLLFEKLKRQGYTKSRRTNAAQIKEKAPILPEDIYRSFAHLTITKEEVKRIIEMGYNIGQVDFILGSIENYKKNTNYNSLNLTAINWLKREYKDVVIQTPQSKRRKTID